MIHLNMESTIDIDINLFGRDQNRCGLTGKPGEKFDTLFGVGQVFVQMLIFGWNILRIHLMLGQLLSHGVYNAAGRLGRCLVLGGTGLFTARGFFAGKGRHGLGSRRVGGKRLGRGGSHP